MCHYTHFTTEEREKSRVLKAQGLSRCKKSPPTKKTAILQEKQDSSLFLWYN